MLLEIGSFYLDNKGGNSSTFVAFIHINCKILGINIIQPITEDEIATKAIE